MVPEKTENVHHRRTPPRVGNILWGIIRHTYWCVCTNTIHNDTIQERHCKNITLEKEVSTPSLPRVTQGRQAGGQ